MRALSFIALVAVGCGGSLPEDFKEEEARCTANLPPEAPIVASPFPGSEDLLVSEVVISASQFRDVDGDAMGGAEVEIWAASPSGALTARLWSAAFDSMPPEVSLSDGTFDLGLDALQDDTDYATRVRYRDARQPVGDMECAQWGAWSEPRYFSTDNGSRALYDDTKPLQDIYLEIPPESWGPINTEARPPGCVPYKRNYYKGAITIGGQRFDNVGLRAKGGCGSARNLSGKANFRVNLEWDDPAVPGCPAKRRFAGQRTFTFNNGVQDRTAGHERLAYEYYHAMGVASSRAVSVRMHVNGQYWGVYQMLEPVERSMLKRWFKSNGGMLYEGTYWCDIVAGNLPVGDVDNKCLTRKFHPTVCDGEPDPGDDPQTYDPLRTFVTKLDALTPGQYDPEVRAFVDLDAFLSLWAADSVLDNWDDYALNIVNNYRIYHDPAVDQWYIIPSGVDQTQVSDGVNPFGPNGRLASMCIADRDCKDKFAARLREAAAVWESMDFVDRAQQIHDQIKDDIMRDPRKEYSNDTWENTNASWRNWIRNRPAQIRQRLANAGYPGP